MPSSRARRGDDRPVPPSARPAVEKSGPASGPRAGEAPLMRHTSLTPELTHSQFRIRAPLRAPRPRGVALRRGRPRPPGHVRPHAPRRRPLPGRFSFLHHFRRRRRRPPLRRRRRSARAGERRVPRREGQLAADALPRGLLRRREALIMLRLPSVTPGDHVAPELLARARLPPRRLLRWNRFYFRIGLVALNARSSRRSRGGLEGPPVVRARLRVGRERRVAP